MYSFSWSRFYILRFSVPSDFLECPYLYTEITTEALFKG